MSKSKTQAKVAEPETKERKVKTAEESPYVYATELLLERKFSDTEIFDKVLERFPGSAYKRDYISVTRSDLNNGRLSRWEKPAEPVARIKEEKPEQVQEPEPVKTKAKSKSKTSKKSRKR
jgi:hypothetical protein